MIESLYAVIVLLGLIPLMIGVVYLLKRFGVAGSPSSHPIKIKSQASLGGRERIVCVEIQGRHFVLGVTPHSISCLHSQQLTQSRGEL